MVRKSVIAKIPTGVAAVTQNILVIIVFPITTKKPRRIGKKLNTSKKLMMKNERRANLLLLGPKSVLTI